MLTITQEILDVVNLHETGLSVAEIAIETGMNFKKVEKHLNSYKKYINWGKPEKIEKPARDVKGLKEGFERFLEDNGRLPMIHEVDKTSYLPSSRYIQRHFGGLMKVREALGYGTVNMNAGKHGGDERKKILVRAVKAEDELEELLVKRFGELYVHSEKRFGGVKRNRADFVVYARNKTVGMDVFTITERRTLLNNVNAKVKKYGLWPPQTQLFFVVWGIDITQHEIDLAIDGKRGVDIMLPFLRVVNVSTLTDYLLKLEPLSVPDGFVSLGVGNSEKPVRNDVDYV